ncbi:unnamed protein product [Adineta steineri]|uniref:G-protein coupled receptors family 1 profile domain-containing protein n=1 Tax=Adineta steineri TaxID=433720 RepID=A0A818TSM1_9BILA|nr:unnamed protein product [Adineta steineri]CAF3691353.1 unnamed protein product [Adineta steineri]
MMNNGSMLAANNIADNITFNDNLSSSSDFFAGGSTTGIAMLSIISVTTVLAIAYSILIVIKPTFRKNKLNWFTVNVCLASACSVNTTFLPYYTIIIALFLPITIITMCNTRTLLFVRNSTRRVHAAKTTGQVSHKRDIVLVKITISSFITFVVGWTPFFAVQLFNKGASIPDILNSFFQILVPSSILYGVIILISTNQPVRTFLIELVTRRGRQV